MAQLSTPHHSPVPSQFASILRDAAGPRPRIIISGAGPVGLTVALMLHEHLNGSVEIVIYDYRLKSVGGRLQWKGAKEGNSRRQQVVTIQSNVYSRLPRVAQTAMFANNEYFEMWPFGPDSPFDVGRPRNVRIQSFEDALLSAIQNLTSFRIVPDHFDPTVESDADVLLICEGPRSKTRSEFQRAFGQRTRDLYSIDDSPLEETVIGIEVTTQYPPEATVPLTTSQTRFLLNADSSGRGFLNMRLAPEEASEVVGIGQNSVVPCIQSRPCTMIRKGSGFQCPTHQSWFKPAIDKHSFLWPRIQDGLRVFGVKDQDLHSISAFRLSMDHVPKFSAEIAPGKFAFLLGDAANSLHFWPGRGLNTGLKSAISFARCFHAAWSGPGKLRIADFTRHEGLMHELQFREKSRAWAAMTMMDDGHPRPIAERIKEGLNNPFDRVKCQEILVKRIYQIRQRLLGRMDNLPPIGWYREKFFGISDETLSVLRASGPWVTRKVGGEEVNFTKRYDS